MNVLLLKHIERIGRRIFGVGFNGSRIFLAEALDLEIAIKIASAIAGYYRIPLKEYDDNSRKKFQTFMWYRK